LILALVVVELIEYEEELVIAQPGLVEHGIEVKLSLAQHI
jgi:hypothetical protein